MGVSWTHNSDYIKLLFPLCKTLSKNYLLLYTFIILDSSITYEEHCAQSDTNRRRTFLQKLTAHEPLKNQLENKSSNIII